MDNFFQWFKYHHDEITWWIIGWLSFSVIDCISRSSWFWAAINAVLIFVNYRIWKNNNA